MSRAPRSGARGARLPEAPVAANCCPTAQGSDRRDRRPTLKFTNLKKLYYPDDGVTKRDVLNYYDAVADLILPHLEDRPLSLKRYPNGIKEEYFFQKHTPETYPAVAAHGDDHSERPPDAIRYVFAEDRASLLYLVNLGCIDHNPWMSRSQHLDNPDFVLIDLDPQECPFDMIVDAALMVKRVLDEIGLTGYPKTTGGDGMHVYIPVEPVYTYEETRMFAELISRLVIAREAGDVHHAAVGLQAAEESRLFRLPAERKIEDDRRARTCCGPIPGRRWRRRWSGARCGGACIPKQFTIANARERFAEKGDLFAACWRSRSGWKRPCPSWSNSFSR